MVLSARRVSATCAATLPLAVLLTGCVSTQTVGRACPPGRCSDHHQSEPDRGDPGESRRERRRTSGDPRRHRHRDRSHAAKRRGPLAHRPADFHRRPHTVRTHEVSEPLGQSRLLRESHRVHRVSRRDRMGVHDDAAHPSRPAVRYRRLFSAAFDRRSIAAVARRVKARQSKRLQHWGSRSPIIPRSPNTTFRSTRSRLRDGHEVAAGRTTVTHLGTNGTQTSSVSLLGTSHYSSLLLIATPTIFH